MPGSGLGDPAPIVHAVKHSDRHRGLGPADSLSTVVAGDLCAPEETMGSVACLSRVVRLAGFSLALLLALAAPALAQPLDVDFSTATGFGGGSLGPLEFQINGIQLDVANPFDPSQVLTSTFNVKWRFDNNPASSSYLHLIPVGVVQTGGGGSTTQRGSVTIRVNSATTGQAIAGAAVSYSGGSSQNTGADGTTTFSNVPAGSPVQFTASATGYVATSAGVTPVANTTASATISLPPVDPSLGQGYRIVLNWGANPRDLDSHITGPPPTGTTRFHIYYASANRSGSTAANTSLPYLDVDDTSGHGPETITILEPAIRAGLYRYSVHQFAGESTMCATAAEIRVNLYRGTTLLRTFTPPSTGCTGGTNNVWTVFTLDGATGAVTPVGTYSGPTSASAVQKPYAGAVVESEEPGLFDALPFKE
jgi:hypothetical protein